VLISIASIGDGRQHLGIRLDLGKPGEAALREMAEEYNVRRNPHPISVAEAKALLDKVVSCLKEQVFDDREVDQVRALDLPRTDVKISIPGGVVYYFTVSKFVK
jgi:hypothetical protein